ncbi:MAG: UvrD-helicase domain-containing protein [Candidatus Kapabacteria bacterium]|nr:UvrD-helicase domain-containing protein [Candidatus Kapabacteria bacterium]
MIIKKMENPAEIESLRTLDRVYRALSKGNCFRVEAGAGAGKTYSLIKALYWLIQNKASDFNRKNQKVACITYTNVAVDEIKRRIDNDTMIFVDTIHGFSWSIIKDFQKQLRGLISDGLNDPKLIEKINEIGGLKNQKIIYDLGYRRASETDIYLHHDNVVKLFSLMLNEKKFIQLLKGKYPVIFIDEYQDTNKELANSIISNIIESSSGIQVGLFGDHWQKIYGDGVGYISSIKIEEIQKGTNFRSNRLLVEMLNRMRPELPQIEKDPSSKGEIKVFHTNNYSGARRDGKGGGHWNGDLITEVAHQYFIDLQTQLANDGWDFEKTKILMLTNNVIAKEQGFENIAKLFTYNDDYLKFQNSYIDFFVNTIEQVSESFSNKKYGQMFQVLGIRNIRLKNQNEKVEWQNSMKILIQLRESGTISEILEHLKESEKPRLSSKLEDCENRFDKLQGIKEFENDSDKSFFSLVDSLKEVKYSEIVSLAKYINDNTPFSTNHGVKGAEFDNVLIICGRGWNKYNWDNFLSWANVGIPRDKEEFFESNKNLFYVSCSRPKNRLAILFTQQLSENSLKTLKNWFLEENIFPFPNQSF